MLYIAAASILDRTTVSIVVRAIIAVSIVIVTPLYIIAACIYIIVTDKGDSENGRRKII